MKHIKLFFVVLGILMLVLVGCSDNGLTTKPEESKADKAPLNETMHSIKLFNNQMASEYPIWAGQNINAGTVSIINDNNYIYVTYNTVNGWMLKETHVHVANNINGIPRTKQGIPIPGQFAYSMNHDPVINTYTYNIPLANYNFQMGQEIIIAAHAALVNGNYPYGEYQEETGWGGNEPGPGPRWWYYIRYTLIDHNPGGSGGDFNTETAMMRMYDIPNNFTYNWGNHPWFSYVKMYPGAMPQTFYFYAAQHYKVGEVEIWKDGMTLYVEVNLDAPYEMQQSHLNVQLTGYSGPPSFGLFPYTMSHNPRVTTYLYAVPWNNVWDGMELNIALHGEVGPF